MQNTGPRRFPRSASGEKLARAGIADVRLNFARLPERVQIDGAGASVDSESRAVAFRLGA